MIETVLFDMGNVLVYFSHPLMCEQIAQVCGCPAEEIRRLLFDREWEGELERGEVSEVELQQRLENHFQRPLELTALIRAASDIFTLNAPLIPILQSLKRQGKRLVLLSNTSVSHYQFVTREFEVLSYFDDFVLSFEVGAMKPDDAIYRAALDKIRCAAEHCFYTDDIAPYILAGRQHGLQAELFITAEALTQQLQQRGISIG